MDADKLKELREVGYAIPRTCGMCRHGEFIPSVVLGCELPIYSSWGTCGLHTYEHQKHTDAKRQLSIYRGGSCSEFRINDDVAAELGAFAEFIDGGP